jgi:hypothetical protein
MRRRALVLGVALVAVALAALSAAALVPGGPTALPEPSGWGPNLVQNGDFEALDADGRPEHWQAPSPRWSVDRGRDGGRAFRLTDPSATPEYDHASQTLHLARGVYRLSGWIKTENLGANVPRSGVRLSLGRRSTPVVSGTTEWTRYEVAPIVVSEDGAVPLRLEVYAGRRDGRSVQPTGTAWFDDVRVEPQVPAGVEAFMLYPNFRGMLFAEGPAVMRFEVTVAAPARGLVRASVVEEGADRVVATRDFPASARFVAELDGEVLEAGRSYLVSFARLDGPDGPVLARTPPYRVSRVPAGVRARMTVAFDEKNRVLVRGVPRFVLGVYDSSGSYSDSERFWEEALWSSRGRRLDGVRINFYLNYKLGQASLPAMTALLDSLHRRGVLYLQTGNCHEGRPADARPFAIQSDRYVRALGGHPAAAGYYTVDECRPSVLPSVFAQYERLRRLDPDSLTLAVQTAPHELPLWRDAADVLATDPYPLFRRPPPGGYRHGLVGEWTRLTREAVRDARPVMTVLQFFTFQGSPWPTLAEMRNHAYMAVVEGARGLWWWSIGDGRGALERVCRGWCPEKVELMERLRTVVNELADLEPALTAEDGPDVPVQPPTVRARTRRWGDRLYLFAYNATATPTEATFVLPGPPSRGHVHGEGGGPLRVEGHRFTDRLEGWQARVYVLDLS